MWMHLDQAHVHVLMFTPNLRCVPQGKNMKTDIWIYLRSVFSA